MAKKSHSAPNTGQSWNGNGDTTITDTTPTPRVSRRMLERAKLIDTISELETKYPAPRPKVVRNRIRALRGKLNQANK